MTGVQTCALPISAALVKSGAYKCVAVTAGGCTAKLGMNGKDHVKKGLPILEDCLAGFCVILSENDGVNPEINLDILKHGLKIYNATRGGKLEIFERINFDDLFKDNFLVGEKNI